MRHRLLVLATMLVALPFVSGSYADDLHVLTWAGYLPEDVLAEYEKASGTKLRVSTYDSNESLYEKLNDPAVPCDVCVPSDYMVGNLIEDELLQELDIDNIPNLKHLDKRFLNLDFDPANKFSVPFLWGTSGIGFNKREVPSVDSWAALFDPKRAGKVSMLDDARECFGAALKTLGRPVNETDKDWLAKARDVLAKQQPGVVRYDSEEFVELLTSGQVDVAHGYSGELAMLAAENPEDYGFVVPKEGAIMNVDNLCIPKKSASAANANAFINYLSQPEIAARIVNTSGYASANEAAKSHIKPSILNDKGIYPDDEILGRCESIKELGASGGPLGESSTWIDEAWKKLRGL